MGQRLKPSPRGEIAGSRGGRSTTRRRADRDPAARRGAIVRPRLLAALDAGSDARLTLVTGPPGCGKTVLLSTWLATRDAQTVLISLDAGDRTTAGLWGKLSQVLQAPRQRAARPGPATPEALVERLLEITAPSAAGSVRTLILDDLHLADSPATRATLTALLRSESAPRLVIGSRIDPALALQRLRLAGSLTEIRGPDLAFTLDEAQAMLTADGIALSPAMLQRLWTRTEGWAAGLRLAALSLAGHEDPDAFVEDFAGDDRAVVAYLIEEVLERQSEQVRELLLATAVVDHVCAPLANALTGRGDAVTIFDDLLHANAFLVPLDRRGEWFRYHALFADLLRSQLARRGPAVVARQHRRAAHWFVEQDRPLDALAHSVSAQDWDGATAIMGDRWLELRAVDGGAALDRVLAAFPPDAIDARPEAALVAAMRCLDRGESDRADAHLLAAGCLRHRLSGSRRAVFTRGLSLVRLLRAGRDGDLDSGVRELSVVETFGHQDSPRAREAVALAHLEVGRLEATAGADGAERRLRLAERLATASSAGPELALEARAQRAWLYALDGELRAARLAADAAATHAELLAAPTPALLAGALVAADAGDLRHAAEQVCAARTALSGATVEPGRLRRLEIAFVDARLAQAGLRAEIAVACDQLRDALAGWTPPRRLDDEARGAAAELLVALGRAEEALAELPDRSDGGGGAIGVARVAALLALDRSEQALGEGERVMAYEQLPLPVAVAAAARTAAAAEAEGDRGLAQRYAEHALDLAETEGVRLPLAAAMSDLDPVLRRLLRFGTAHRSLIGEVMELARSGTAPSAADVAPLDETLSDRELAVLRYLPTLLSSTEIAGELFVSVNTVKSHLKGVYRKLGVGNRREAVERARDLGLIAVSGLSVERRSPASSPPAPSAG
jgi:LuxR family transcriptional regulator, maltose regulon positive regulatory protein